MAKIGIVSGKVRGLIRVSSGQQDPESQRKVLDAFAKQEEFTFQRIDMEHGRPRGQGEDSEVFQKLIIEGKARIYDWLVVDHSDRLGAYDADEYGYYITPLKRAGVRVWAVNRGELTKDDTVTSLTNTLDHINSLDERRKLAEKVSRGVREKAMMGFEVDPKV